MNENKSTPESLSNSTNISSNLGSKSNMSGRTDIEIYESFSSTKTINSTNTMGGSGYSIDNKGGNMNIFSPNDNRTIETTINPDISTGGVSGVGGGNDGGSYSPYQPSQIPDNDLKAFLLRSRG